MHVLFLDVVFVGVDVVDDVFVGIAVISIVLIVALVWLLFLYSC